MILIAESRHHHERAMFYGSGEEALIWLTYLKNFWLFIPQFYIETVLIPQTNNRVKVSPLSFGYLLRFIKLCLLIKSHPGYKRRFCFEDKSIAIFEGTPIRLNIYMTGNISKNIIAALLFTYIKPPYFKDKFFEALQTIFA